MSDYPAPFATRPPSGRPELIEHDACALAGFATRDGLPSRELLELALRSLQMMVHRGGSVDGEGDGSGIQIDIPRELWRGRLAEAGHSGELAVDPRFVVAHIFFGGEEQAVDQVPRIHAIAEAEGFEILISAASPVDIEALGPRAAENPPIFWQIAGRAADSGRAAAQACARVMFAVEAQMDAHIASFSANDCVYKVQGQPEVLPRFIPELADPAVTTARLIAHNRYSTNTYPTFSRVQPFAVLGHNGEVNTIAQLREQSEQLGVPTTRDGSDSQDLNRLIEGLIHQKGLSLLEAVEFALPPILGEVHRLPAQLQDLYVHYREAWGPYAQGPVALACRVGDEMVFAVDALGLRPLWWVETDDAYVVSSEPGIVALSDIIRDPEPLSPGEKVGLITSGDDPAPVVLSYRELQNEVYRRAKERGALPHAETRARLAGGLDPVAEDHRNGEPEEPELELDTLLAANGWIQSDLQQLQFHVDRSAEPIGSLGWDGPLGPFTPVQMPLSDYLQETVAVVTNPAIDREREVEHFSTRIVLGRRPPIVGIEPQPPQRAELRMPIILGGMRPGAHLSLPDLRRVAAADGVCCMEDLLAAWGDRAMIIPLTYGRERSVGDYLAELARIVVEAVRGGAELLVLSDLAAGPQEKVCDPLIAVAAADKALRQTFTDGASIRRDVSLVLQSAGIRNVHDVMMAIGFGAQAMCPYAMIEKVTQLTPEPIEGVGHVLSALQKGMEKVLSTLGIHEIRGYARLVSAIGVEPELLDILEIPGFCASPGRGLGLAGLDAFAEQGRQIRAGEEDPKKVKLPRMYPKVWKALARVATSEAGYDEFAATLDQLEQGQPVALRHALAPQLAPEDERIPAGQVSSAIGDHSLPFLISSMSFGSQGETAFRAYPEAAMRADMLAMNGEGGEPQDMYGLYPKHRGQQVASGRFGVSSLLINSSEWVEIKIGQGAKPGEGGHLPGSKVTEAIARARNAQVGSDLISPSNNHDLYSIEDLAQLVDELKTANPHVKVIVKVPVVPGIGTISIGIAKTGADVICMSGFDGGTGAARQHALRRAGLPCELGTVLAHHALTEAGIRDRVELWADGGLRSAMDAIKLICLGANRLGYGTASMVAIGCTICRGCQLDTCHVGIATQVTTQAEADHKGMKRFVPREHEPAVEALTRYFTEMGAALRRIAGEMGVASVQDLVGRADRLVQVSHHDRVDLTGLLTPTRSAIITAPPGGPRYFRPFNPPPRHRAPETAVAQIATGAALAVEEATITAADRNLGTDLAGLIARHRTGFHDQLDASTTNGDDPMPGAAALVDLSFTHGAATGSGLAAFTIAGVRVRVFGGAQDGVGKCALGGEIQILKTQNKHGAWVGGHVGKSFAYGAQRGLFLVQGDVDARAAIRLSGADIVLGGEPRQPLNDRLGTLGARANCKGFAFEYMTGGRVVVMGDPGPWICSGMTGGLVYVRQNAEWNLNEAAIRRRLSKAAKVSIVHIDEEDPLMAHHVDNLRELLGHYRAAMVESGQDEYAATLDPLIAEPAKHFLALDPLTQQADPNISTE